MTDTNCFEFNFREDMSDIIPSVDYATHSIHPYIAKIIPHIPRYFIEKYTNIGDSVLDPFCGSGTTLLEALISGRKSIGVDINPLSILISKVKTTFYDADELADDIDIVKSEIKNNKDKIQLSFPNIDYWFCDTAINELGSIKYCLNNLKDDLSINAFNFFMVCFSSIIRKSSYADPRISKTYKSKNIRKKIEKGWKPKPIDNFIESIDKNFLKVKSLLSYKRTNCSAKVLLGDVRDLSKLIDKRDSVDFIFGSPPYINAQDYFRTFKHELWWLGLSSVEESEKLKKLFIGTERISGYDYKEIPCFDLPILNNILYKIWNRDRKKSYIIYNYFKDMDLVFKQSKELLNNKGYLGLVSGANNICGIEVPTYKIFIELGKQNGFKLLEIGRDKIKNRSLPPIRNHDRGVINEDWANIFSI